MKVYHYYHCVYTMFKQLAEKACRRVKFYIALRKRWRIMKRKKEIKKRDKPNCKIKEHYRRDKEEYGDKYLLHGPKCISTIKT